MSNENKKDFNDMINNKKDCLWNRWWNGHWHIRIKNKRKKFTSICVRFGKKIYEKVINWYFKVNL